MASYRELENNLKAFLIDVQSDAHNIKTLSASRYNNIKIGMIIKRRNIVLKCIIKIISVGSI